MRGRDDQEGMLGMVQQAGRVKSDCLTVADSGTDSDLSLPVCLSVTLSLCLSVEMMMTMMKAD